MCSQGGLPRESILEQMLKRNEENILERRDYSCKSYWDSI